MLIIFAFSHILIILGFSLSLADYIFCVLLVLFLIICLTFDSSTHFSFSLSALSFHEGIFTENTASSDTLLRKKRQLKAVMKEQVVKW